MSNNRDKEQDEHDIPAPLGPPETSSKDSASISVEPLEEREPYATEEGLPVVRQVESEGEQNTQEEFTLASYAVSTFIPGEDSIEDTEDEEEPVRRTTSLRQALFFSVLGSLLVLGVLFVSTKWFHIPSIDALFDDSEAGFFDFVLSDEYGDIAFGEKDRINLLVLGVDYNYNEEGIRYSAYGRTDTIIVLSLDKKARFLNLLSIPRDTRVEIDPYIGFDKINTAYSYGGIPQAMETVQRFLGVKIDHYLLVRVQAAEDIVEAMGGVTVHVEKDMDYDDNWGHLHIHLKEGKQELNGQQLVGYARFRMDAEGDRGRIRRQQQVIKALTGKLKSPSMITNLSAIADAVKKNFDTDMQPLELLDLARVYASFDTRNVHGSAIEGDDIMIGGVAYIHPYWVQNERVVRQYLKDEQAFKRLGIHLAIRNQAKDINWGYSLADLLEDSGYDIARVTTDDRSDRAQTELKIYGATQEQIKTMQKDFPGVKINKVKELTPEEIEQYDNITVELVLGDDYGEQLWDKDSDLYKRFAIDPDDGPASYSAPASDTPDYLEETDEAYSVSGGEPDGDPYVEADFVAEPEVDEEATVVVPEPTVEVISEPEAIVEEPPVVEEVLPLPHDVLEDS